MTKDEALKMALEALEAHADIGIKADKAITAIREALAQPEQETDLTTCPNCEYHKNRAARWRAEAYKQAGHDVIELPWVGLTDEEIMEMLDYGQYGRVPQYARNFVDAIEAKLKEKNT